MLNYFMVAGIDEEVQCDDWVFLFCNDVFKPKLDRAFLKLKKREKLAACGFETRKSIPKLFDLHAQTI